MKTNQDIALEILVEIVQETKDPITLHNLCIDLQNLTTDILYKLSLMEKR